MREWIDTAGTIHEDSWPSYLSRIGKTVPIRLGEIYVTSRATSERTKSSGSIAEAEPSQRLALEIELGRPAGIPESETADERVLVRASAAVWR